MRQSAEAQADIEHRRIHVRFTDLRACRAPAPLDAEAGRGHELELRDAHELIFRLGLDAVPAEAAGVQPGRARADRNREVGEDGLRPFAADVEFLHAVRVLRQPGDGGKGEFIGDAGIVDRQRGGEDAVAADGVGVGGDGSQRDERAGKRARGQADREKRHERKTSSLKECERTPKGARAE